MTISIGARLGPYEIVAPLGAGGMGEVYRARDTRLDREVAVKMLPADFSRDADRLRRFEQEARATSALNHPNILTIYDIGTASTESGDAPFIVAELLDGEELRAQLNGSAIPQRKAVDYARQIADGLSAAHAKGIVHRDLKPENLFVTTDGRVKILDFGLAKLTGLRIADRRLRNEEIETLMQSPQSPIRNPQLTDPGTVMGTVGYMSPEQVRGQEADHRADIFSFGVILYEMLSGHRAFSGDSAIEVMNAILKEEPPELGESNAKISPALDKIVRRCLEKKPEHRFQTASDLGFALGTLTTPSGARLDTTTAATESAAVSAARWFGNARLWMVVAAVAVLVSLISLPFAVKYLRLSPPAAPVAARFTIVAPEKATSIEAPELSPDGRHLVFIALTEGRRSLWLRPLGSPTAQPLPGTEGVFGVPFWSPDSHSIGFVTGDELRKLDLAGGAPQTLCKLPSAVGTIFDGTWNRDGVILFSDVAGGFIASRRRAASRRWRCDQTSRRFTPGLSFYLTVAISSFAGHSHRGRRKFISLRSTARRPHACWRRIHRRAMPTVICFLRAPEPCARCPSMPTA